MSSLGVLFAMFLILTPIILPITIIIILIVIHERKKTKLLQEQNQLLKDLKESK